MKQFENKDASHLISETTGIFNMWNIGINLFCQKAITERTFNAPFVLSLLYRSNFIMLLPSSGLNVMVPAYVLSASEDVQNQTEPVVAIVDVELLYAAAALI